MPGAMSLKYFRDLYKDFKKFDENRTSENATDLAFDMPGIKDLPEDLKTKMQEDIKKTGGDLEKHKKYMEDFYKDWTSDNNGNDLTEVEKYIRDRNIAREAIEEAKRTIKYKMEGTRNTVKDNEARKVKLNELLKKYEDGNAMTTEDKKEKDWNMI